MTIYIAGPMKGLPGYNRAAFREAAEALERKGHTPINPGLLPATLKEEAYMPICTAMIDAADAVLLLSKWSTSDGAILEFRYAQYQGKEIYDGVDEVPEAKDDHAQL